MSHVSTKFMQTAINPIPNQMMSTLQTELDLTKKLNEELEEQDRRRSKDNNEERNLIEQNLRDSTIKSHANAVELVEERTHNATLLASNTQLLQESEQHKATIEDKNSCTFRHDLSVKLQDLFYRARILSPQ
jgi:hypothetical protein